MSLQIGQLLGSYEITGLLGKGGMGEVYSARDVRLKRQVAIKVLPDEFCRNTERVSRFRREAELPASLNHPHIAAIYHVQQSGELTLLVLELVEGETLADRIARGRVGIDKALELSRNIAEALEAAHEKEIVHRDLKPANIKITPDRGVKVLDFGLAKTIARDDVRLDTSEFPTAITTETGGGAVAGTAAYMSPEQIQGRPLDKRTDIFSFGCVLYELLTGKPAFEGENEQDILSRILQREPDWTLLPPGLPPRIRELLGLCLEKDLKKRRQSAGDLRIDIEQALKEPVKGALVEAAMPAWRLRLAWITAALFAGLGAVGISLLLRPAPDAPEMRVQIVTPPALAPAGFALSPDGRQIVFVASGEEPRRLWLRAVDRTEVQPISGTEDASLPFWSPDSRSIGFFASGKLYRVDVGGGLPHFLANSPSPGGATWNADGTILFAPTTTSPLLRVAVAGGDPTPVTRLDPPRQNSHQFPYFLPDGHHFIFYSTGPTGLAGTHLGSLDGGKPKLLMDTGYTQYLKPDLLVYVWHGALTGRRLDIRRGELTGNPVTIADPGSNYESVLNFSVSASGAVAYRTGGTQLAWYDRSGKPLGVLGGAGASGAYPDLAPDGRRVAVARGGPNHDVWLIDLVRGGVARLTVDTADHNPQVWSPDGTQIAFASDEKGVYNLYLKQSNGVGPEQLLQTSPNFQVPTDWSKDGQFLLYYETDPTTARDVWALPMTGSDRKPRVVVNTPFDERSGQFSPDTHWVAYETNQSGPYDIVVQPFRESTNKWQVSTGGGVQPRWSADGKELYYVAPDGKLMAVSVAVRGATLERGRPISLFSTRIMRGEAPFKAQYAVSRDGRFLIHEVAQSSLSPITLILNWKPKP
jgi:Tol biopolymer transport system component